MIRIRILEVFVKKQQKNKKIALPVLAAVFALAALVVGFTIAYSRDRSILPNEFDIAKYQTEVIEEFTSPSNWTTCETTPKTYQVVNYSDMPVSVRVKVDESWKSSAGRSLPLVSNNSRVRMAVINYANSADWTLKSYGGRQYYVYNTDLRPGASTSTLMTGVTLNCDADLGADVDYNNAEYHLLLTAQTIQADKRSEAWRTRVTWNREFQSAFDYWINASAITDGDVCKSSDAGTQYKAISCVKRLERSYTNPVGTIAPFYIRGIGGGDSPLLAWLSDDYRTLYWYTEADEVYLPSDCSNLFSNMYLETLDSLEQVNTSEVTNMYYMFYYDTNLSDVSALASWDVSNVSNMRYTFFYTMLSSLEPFRNWDVSRVTKMDMMFTQDRKNYAVSSAEPLSGWNVANVVDMKGLFWNFEDFDASSLNGWTLNPNLWYDSQTFGCSVTTPTWFTREHNPCS